MEIRFEFERVGVAETIRAARPATSGQENEVPFQAAYGLAGSKYVVMIPCPGAKIGTKLPNEENEARVSSGAVAPTASTCAQAAGYCGTLAPVFPAAATTST